MTKASFQPGFKLLIANLCFNAIKGNKNMCINIGKLTYLYLGANIILPLGEALEKPVVFWEKHQKRKNLQKKNWDNGYLFELTFNAYQRSAARENRYCYNAKSNGTKWGIVEFILA